MRVLYCLALTSCAIAFGAGTRQAPTPAKFADVKSHTQEQQAEMGSLPVGAPTLGMSLVAGGRAFDAGGLPRPPVPIASPL